MKKLDVSAISSIAGMPVKQGIWQHLQSAYAEAIGEVGKALFGNSYDPTSVYILQGCVNSGTGSAYNITAGSVFFNGEVYLVDAASFTISGSNVAEYSLITTYYTGANADSVQFTDGSSHNIHQIIKAQITGALSGSGIGDYANAIDINYMPQGGIGQTIIWTMPGSGSQSSLLPTFFNSSGNGIHPLTFNWQIDAALSGFTLAAYKTGDALFGTLGQTQGAATKQLLAANIPPLSTDSNFAVGSGSATAYSASTTAGSAGPIGVNASSPNTAISLIQPTVTALYIKRYK